MTTRKAATRPQTVRKPVAGKPADHLAPTPASGWKKAGGLLTLPSGNTMRLKNPGITGLAHMGLVPNSLMNIIMGSIQKGVEPSADTMLENVELNEMFEMMSKAIIVMAVEPEVHPLPEEGEPRDENLVYIDDITEEDKMFIWQWATGGTEDVEQFRRESTGMLGTVPGLSAVGQKPKRGPAARG